MMLLQGRDRHRRRLPPKILAFLRSSGAQTGGSGPASLGGTIGSSDYSSASDGGLEDEAENEEAWRNQDGLDDMSGFREADFAWSDDERLPMLGVQGEQELADSARPRAADDEGGARVEHVDKDASHRARVMTETYLNALATTPGVYRVGGHLTEPAAGSPPSTSGAASTSAGSMSSTSTSSSGAGTGAGSSSSSSPANVDTGSPPGPSSWPSVSATAPDPASSSPATHANGNDAVWCEGLDEEQSARMRAGLAAGRLLDSQLQERQRAALGPDNRG